MKDYCECDAQLRAEKDLVVRVLSEEHSAESQEDEEQDHGYGHSHLDDVGCTEDCHLTLLDTNVCIKMEVDRIPKKNVVDHVARWVTESCVTRSERGYI